MQVDGQLESAQLEQIADDAPTPAALGRMYLNTKNAGASPFMRGLARWEKVLTDNTANADKVANYTLTVKDEVVRFNAAGGSLVPTLPPVASVAGKTFTIIRTDTVIANDVTITPDVNTELIDGSTTFILKTKNDAVKLLSNGVAWLLISHSYDTGWFACQPGTANWVVNTTVLCQYRRNGKCIDVEWNFALAGAPDAATLLLCLPNGFQIDFTAMAKSTAGYQLFPGNILVWDNSATERYHGWASINDLNSFTAFKDDGDGTISVINATNPMTFAVSDNVNARISEIPIIKLR